VFDFADNPASPGGISDQELKEIFDDGWRIESLQPVTGGHGVWKMNFAVILREP
jgi:hypothetical protein